MEYGNSPRILTTKCRVKYRQSSWRVHEFEVWNGELVCKVAVLRMEKSVLVWLGERSALLQEVALGVPARGESGAWATALLGEAGTAVTLARRLALVLARPATVCCGCTFDRFTAPLVDSAIAAEIKHHPENF